MAGPEDDAALERGPAWWQWEGTGGTAVQAGRLHFTADVAQGVPFGTMQFITVGTLAAPTALALALALAA